MNLKSLLLVLSFLSGIMVSCSNEEIIDIPDQSVEGISIILSSNPITTKAKGEAADPYAYATQQELQITNAHIAVFEMNSEGIPETKIFSDTYTMTPDVTTTDTLAYKIEGITLKAAGKKVRFLAIGNPKGDYSGCSDYNSYKTFVENNNSATFDPTKLVKVGELDYEFGSSSAVVSPIEIPMIQLAARVDIKLAVDLPETVYTPTAEYQYSENDVLNWGKQLSDKPGDVSASVCTEKVSYEGIEYNASYKKAHINSWVDSVYTTGEWRLNIGSVTVNNIETQSNIILSSVNTKKSLLPDNTNSFVKDGDMLRMTLYTYEKAPLEDTSSDILNVTFNNTYLEYGQSVVKRRYSGIAHGMWTKNGVFINGWESGGPNDGYAFKYIGNSVTIDQNTEPTEEWIESSDVEAYEMKYVLKVNPKYSPTLPSTAGLIHGNLYSLTATVKNLPERPTPVILSLDWIVNDWRPAKSSDITFN